MNTLPKRVYLITSLALFWHLLLLVMLFANVFITPDNMVSFSRNQAFIYQSSPVWSHYALLLSLVSAVTGCLALLSKNAWAHPLFLLTLVSLAFHNLGLFFISDGLNVVAVHAIVIRVLAGIMVIGLMYLAKHGIKQNWLR